MREIESAMRNMKYKGLRFKDGGFEAYVSEGRKFKSLGTYRTEEQAQKAVLRYRIEKFVQSCKEHNLRPCDGKVFGDNYVVFPSGDVLNLYGRKMTPCVNREGYLAGIINGKTTSYHRIVAMAFIPNPNNYHDVNHINGIKTDNRVENLEWCTRSHNAKHAYDKGLSKKMFGESHHAHKLTDEEVLYARKVYKRRDKNYGAKALAEKFGVNRTTLENAIHKKTWSHI